MMVTAFMEDPSGSPADLTPPPIAGRILRDNFWQVWPVGRPDLAGRIAAPTAQLAVERFAGLAPEIAAIVVVCVDAYGLRLTHWTPAAPIGAVSRWRRCARPTVPGVEGA